MWDRWKKLTAIEKIGVLVSCPLWIPFGIILFLLYSFIVGVAFAFNMQEE